MAQSEDQPDELIGDLFHLDFWPDHPLSWPITGTLESVSRLRREDLLGYRHDHYCPQRIVVSMAGGASHTTLLEALGPVLSSLTGTAQARQDTSASRPSRRLNPPPRTRTNPPQSGRAVCVADCPRVVCGSPAQQCPGWRDELPPVSGNSRATRLGSTMSARFCSRPGTRAIWASICRPAPPWCLRPCA